MTVTDNGNGTFLVTTTPEELASFTQAVTDKLIDGGTPAAALEKYLAGAFSTLVNQARQHMIKEIATRLHEKSASELQTLLVTVRPEVVVRVEP